MATQTETATTPQSDAGAQKIQQLRELFADASDVGKRALENVIKELSSQVSEPPPPIESAGRVGARLGKRSELTMIVPLVPGGAKRLRRSEEHTSELQSLRHLVCRLLLEKKKNEDLKA